MSMFNKTSCRPCGGYLTPTSHCTVCKEYISWVCNSCERLEDVTHNHNYCRVLLDELGNLIEVKEKR